MSAPATSITGTTASSYLGCQRTAAAMRQGKAGALRARLCRLALLVSLLLGGWAGAADASTRTGTIEDDVFLTDSSADIYATITGDLFGAALWLNINSRVSDNLIAAGGMANVAGSVQGDLIIAAVVLDLSANSGDNLIAAGGVATINSEVERKLFASAGRLRLGRDARIGGDAWLAAGSAELAGVIGGDAVVGGGSVVLRGRIEGDVEVTAFSLEVADGAVIGGDLVFRGPEPPDIAEGARIAGEVEHQLEPIGGEPAAQDAGGWPPVFWLLVTLGLGLLLDVLLPRYVHSAGRRLTGHPFSCFGLGLAILITTPVIIVVLVISVLGLAIGIAGIAAYGALLLLGPVVALFGLNDTALARWLPALIRTPGRRRLAFIAALLLLALLTALPYVGTPLVWLVTVTGLGAASWQLYDSVRAEPARPVPPDGGAVRE